MNVRTKIELNKDTGISIREFLQVCKPIAEFIEFLAKDTKGEAKHIYIPKKFLGNSQTYRKIVDCLVGPFPALRLFSSHHIEKWDGCKFTDSEIIVDICWNRKSNSGRAASVLFDICSGDVAFYYKKLKRMNQVVNSCRTIYLQRLQQSKLQGHKFDLFLDLNLIKNSANAQFIIAQEDTVDEADLLKYPTTLVDSFSTVLKFIKIQALNYDDKYTPECFTFHKYHFNVPFLPRLLSIFQAYYYNGKKAVKHFWEQEHFKTIINNFQIIMRHKRI